MHYYPATHQRQPRSPDVLFSRRRSSRRRGPASGQTALPDWVWGAGLGLIVVLFIGGYFAVTQVGGSGGGSSCDDVKPLGSSVINAESFVEEDAGLGRVLDLLSAGDRVGAEAAFYGPVHNFTHNVDPDLRQTDERSARDLCEQVINVETALTERAANANIVAILQNIREMLRDAAETLGYPRPG
jgi:hypothetical protein